MASPCSSGQPDLAQGSSRGFCGCCGCGGRCCGGLIVAPEGRGVDVVVGGVVRGSGDL